MRPPVSDRDVDVRTVHDALDRGAMLVDIREPWELEQARIPGAVHIPMGQVPARLDEIPGDADVYIQCRTGSRSARVVDFLRQRGYERAYNVAGGIEAWAYEGFEVE